MFMEEKTKKKTEQILATQMPIGVIYRYRYAHFLDWGVQYPHFSGRKGEEFDVTCCQQKRSVQIKLQ